jgi:hypothetical protein
LDTLLNDTINQYTAVDVAMVDCPITDYDRFCNVLAECLIGILKPADTRNQPKPPPLTRQQRLAQRQL